jgi:hypothetical protein
MTSRKEAIGQTLNLIQEFKPIADAYSGPNQKNRVSRTEFNTAFLQITDGITPQSKHLLNSASALAESKLSE